MTYNLPVDISCQCIWIVRGYKRNKKEYQAMRKAIIGNDTAAVDPSGVHGTTMHRIVEETMARLEALDKYPAFRQVHAVDEAMCISLDGFPPELREIYKTALLLSCCNGRAYPFERLNAQGLSRSSFYRLRRRFIYEIADTLGLIYKEQNVGGE